MTADSSNALHEREAIVARLQGQLPVVFLDYDGTLVPIADRPELAVLDEATRATLERLSGVVTVAIVSGRACADVRAQVGVAGLYYAGNHGLEIESPGGGSHRFGEQHREAVQAFARAAEAALHDIPGVTVENKDLSLSVHFRLADPADAARIEACLDGLLARFPRLRKRGGKKVFEIRPDVDWDKGKAVVWLLRTLGISPARAIYLGDDETDEDAFRALRGCGVGVRVGGDAAATAAEYRLHDTAEVRRFLQMLTALVPPPG